MQLSKRLGHSVNILGLATLSNHRFAYEGYSQSRGCATANVVWDQNQKVWGVLYLNLSDEDLEKLDLYEGATVEDDIGKKRYFRKTVEVTLANDGIAYDADIYIMDHNGVSSDQAGFPSKEYVLEVIKTALEVGFPDSYIAESILPLCFNQQKVIQ